MDYRDRRGALDPFRGYGAALSTGLPNAVRVLDPFHVVRLGFAAVDDVRRRVQQETYGHRGRRGDPLYGIRRVLRRGADTLSEHAWARLLAGIEAGDDRGQAAKAWVAAQELRAIYRCRDRAQAAVRLYDWTVMCVDSGIAEIVRLARTITTWREEFLAYFTAGRISNGPTEAVNLLIKKILRVGHDSETSTITDSASCCTAESPGIINPRHHYGAAYHAWLRRAPLPRLIAKTRLTVELFESLVDRRTRVGRRGP